MNINNNYYILLNYINNFTVRKFLWFRMLDLFTRKSILYMNIYLLDKIYVFIKNTYIYMYYLYKFNA